MYTLLRFIIYNGMYVFWGGREEGKRSQTIRDLRRDWKTTFDGIQQGYLFIIIAIISLTNFLILCGTRIYYNT